MPPKVSVCLCFRRIVHTGLEEIPQLAHLRVDAILHMVWVQNELWFVSESKFVLAKPEGSTPLLLKPSADHGSEPFDLPPPLQSLQPVSLISLHECSRRDWIVNCFEQLLFEPSDVLLQSINLKTGSQFLWFILWCCQYLGRMCEEFGNTTK